MIKRPIFLVINSQLFLLRNFSKFLYIFTLFIHPSTLNITNKTPHRPDDGSAEPKRYSVDWLCFSINPHFLFGLLVNFSSKIVGLLSIIFFHIYIYIYIYNRISSKEVTRAFCLPYSSVLSYMRHKGILMLSTIVLNLQISFSTNGSHVSLSYPISGNRSVRFMPFLKECSQNETPIDWLSTFLRRGLMIYIIKGFWTIVFLFIVIATTFRPICPPAFFRYFSNSGTFTELRTTSFIESMGVTCSDSVSHNRVQVLSIPVFVTRLQSGLNLQPQDDCLLRSLGNQRL